MEKNLSIVRIKNWDRQQASLYSTGNYIQYPLIKHSGERNNLVNQLYFNKIKFTE